MAECILLEAGETRHLLLQCRKKRRSGVFHHYGAF
jgi:hypothetical protein